MYTKTLSPISRLPTELLSEIMVEAYKSVPNSLRVRLSLSWVSRHWRQVALGDARLWTRLAYDGRNCSGVAMEYYAKDCITRSKQLPLQIDLLQPSTSLRDACLAEVHRVQTLKFHAAFSHGTIFCNDAGSEDSKNFWIERAPLLTSLNLRET